MEFLARERKFTCKCCGLCCHDIKPGFASIQDIKRWENEERHDILRFVDFETRDIWVDPKTRKLVQGMYCPFLVFEGDYCLCEIHETKPYICRNYIPSEKSAKEMGCPGYERND